jgi:membrane-anchored protein YejM (alkaline phosphatase superfamily)
MPKFALKMLLTSLTVGRSTSRRIRGVQVVTAVLTLLLLATVGLYIWAHGGN